MREKTLDQEGSWTRRVRSCLVAQGLAEMLNLSFTSAQLNSLFPGLTPKTSPLAIINPLSAEGAEMRLSLLGGLMRALHHNLRQGETGVTAFELGKVFFQTQAQSQQRHERVTLAGVLYGSWPTVGLGRKGKTIDFADLKGILEGVWQELRCEGGLQWDRATNFSFLHPGKAAMLSISGTSLGVAGALHPNHCTILDFLEAPWVFELDFTTLIHYARPNIRYQALPRFPTVVRDVAIVADEELPVQAVIDAVRALNDPLIVDMRLFDQYRGDPIPQHKQSLAYSISYRAADRTLTALEVNTVHTQVIEHLVRTLRVEVRT